MDGASVLRIGNDFSEPPLIVDEPINLCGSVFLCVIKIREDQVRSSIFMKTQRTQRHRGFSYHYCLGNSEAQRSPCGSVHRVLRFAQVGS